MVPLFPHARNDSSEMQNDPDSRPPALQPLAPPASRCQPHIADATSLLDEFLIESHAIGQDHIAKGALILVVAVGLDRNAFTEGEGRAKTNLPDACPQGSSNS